jgi:hypothetical protein
VTTVPAPALRRRTRFLDGPLAESWRQSALLLVLCLVPLTFVGLTTGAVALTGLAWATGLLVVAPLALVEPVAPPVLRRAAPYLLFLVLGLLSLAVAPDLRLGVSGLVQLVAPLPAFLLAARVRDRERFLRRASAVAQGGIALAVLLTVLATAGVLPAAVGLSPRPMAIALVVLFVVASLACSPARAAVLGGAALAVSAGTGGRTSSAVLLLVLVLCPAFRLGWRGRAGLAGLGLVGIVLASQTTAFQERFFFGAEGSLRDALTASEALNTAGRRELWPRLVESCSDQVLLGGGVGTGSLTADQLTLGVLAQPHNDYLRTYCDVGLAGSVPFWLFFAAAGLAGSRLARRGDPLGSAAASLVLALLLLAVTDNVVLYTAHFMVPTGVVLGLAVRAERTALRG